MLEPLAVIFDCCRHIPVQDVVCSVRVIMQSGLWLPSHQIHRFFLRVYHIHLHKNPLLRLSFCANIYLDSGGHYRPSSAPPSFLRPSLQLCAARATPSRNPPPRPLAKKEAPSYPLPVAATWRSSRFLIFGLRVLLDTALDRKNITRQSSPQHPTIDQSLPSTLRVVYLLGDSYHDNF